MARRVPLTVVELARLQLGWVLADVAEQLHEAALHAAVLQLHLGEPVPLAPAWRTEWAAAQGGGGTERAVAHAFSSVASFMRMTQRWPPLYGRRAGTPFLPKRFLSENLRMTNACGAAAVDMVRELWLEE